MGKRGPRPTPTSVLAARGSKVATYDRPNEPAAESEAPPMPMDLPAEAKKHWEFIVPQLLTRRTLTTADLGVLSGMCRWWARWKSASRAVDRLERSRKKFSGHQLDHPRLRERAAWQEYLKIAMEFGLSPSAKSKVISCTKTDSGDERESIFNGPKLAS